MKTFRKVQRKVIPDVHSMLLQEYNEKFEHKEAVSLVATLISSFLCSYRPLSFPLRVSYGVFFYSLFNVDIHYKSLK